MSNSAESFVVSARKYRPAKWDQVVGQSAITETLQKSIEQDHLAHAYLFCGPRGVGKTTCARIFAKEINLSEDHLEDEDFSFNIFELDAASNNSVNDIRSLTDQVRIPPQVGNYKVYIIDEVHMLSAQAFNAFLKTLEEPPKHAIFILATTEKHKIIPTILSRCQIYDFNRIGVEETVLHLKNICEKESVSFEEEALHVIAQKADGALRDALSIFDQLSNFTNQNLTYASVLKNLHVLDYDYYFKTASFLNLRSYSESLLLLDEILKLGIDGNHFISGLGAHLRDLLICKNPQTLSLLEVGESVKSRYSEQANELDADWLIEALKIVNDSEFRYKNSNNKRLLLEIALLNISSLGLEKKNDSDVVKPILKPTKEPLSSSSNTRTLHEPVPASTLQKVQVAQEKERKPIDETHEEKEVPKGNEPLEEVHKVEHSNESTPAAVDPVQVEEPKPNSLKRKPRRTATISLKIDDEPNSSEDESGSGLDIKTEDTKGEIYSLESAWDKACEHLESSGRHALLSILKKQDREKLFDGKTIRVALAHEVDEDEFISFKTDLLAMLRKLTGDKKLELNSYREELKLDTKLFHSKEKFTHLADKNPNLLKMKSELDLDITF